MRARRTHLANREDYDSFDQPPPEAFDATPEPPIDDSPAEPVMASGPSLSAPIQVCLTCGDDPAINSGCPHFEVATITLLSSVLHNVLAELRAQHDAVRDQLRTLRRLAGGGVASGEVTIEVHEPPVVAPRVVLIPPPMAKRTRRAPQEAVKQGRFGFVEPADEPAAPASPALGATV